MRNILKSLREANSIATGYKLGRLIFDFEKERYLIELENGEEIEVAGLAVEIFNDSDTPEWYQVQEEDYKRFTAEGWPLLAGADCRYKEIAEDEA